MLVAGWASCKLPFQHNIKIEKKPFSKVHCDLWDPSPVASCQQMKCYAAFIDDCTRFAWIYPMRQKSDFFQKMVKNQFSTTIKIFQCNGGGGFQSKGFTNHLEHCGIMRHFMSKHT